MQVVYFLILIGVLIFIHEFGHYFFAKLFGVKVERFAIGMGPVVKALSFTRGETEYTICALPIGGYVKMFGMQPEELYDDWGDALPEAERARAFVRKPIWQRAIIIAAGPVINLIFPIFVYFFLGLGMSTMPPSVVGQVTPQSPASQATPLKKGEVEAGLLAGDLIVAVDGQDVRYWSDLTDIVEVSAGKALTFTVQRGERQIDFTITPEPYTKTDRMGLFQETYGIIGVTSETYGPIIAIQDPGAPAAQAGLKTFDRIVSVGGTPTRSFIAVQAAIEAGGGKPVELVAMRPEPVDFLGGGLQIERHVKATVTPLKEGLRWSIGAVPADMFIASIDPGGPAEAAGLKVGDELLSMDAMPYNKMRLLRYDAQQRFWERMNAEPDTPKTELAISFKLQIKRGLETQEVTWTPSIREFKGKFNEMVPSIWFGFDVYNSYDLPDPIPVPFGDRVVYAATNGVEMTWKFTTMMVNGIVQLIKGRVSTDTIGGPIMIFDIAAKAGEKGIEEFLWMMALISINLGLINLLPIPVLDGGHLMLLAIEAIKRKELSQRTRQIAYYIGFSLIALLMLLAFKNDIERYWQDFASWLNVS